MHCCGPSSTRMLAGSTRKMSDSSTTDWSSELSVFVWTLSIFCASLNVRSYELIVGRATQCRPTNWKYCFSKTTRNDAYNWFGLSGCVARQTGQLIVRMNVPLYEVVEYHHSPRTPLGVTQHKVFPSIWRSINAIS